MSLIFDTCRRPLAQAVSAHHKKVQLNDIKYPCPNKRKMKTTLTFSNKGSPLFCTFDKEIADHINRADRYCVFLPSRHIDSYDFLFCNNKEVWIFHLYDEPDPLTLRFAYALLRHGASKVQIQCFPVEDKRHV